MEAELAATGSLVTLRRKAVGEFESSADLGGASVDDADDVAAVAAVVVPEDVAAADDVACTLTSSLASLML